MEEGTPEATPAPAGPLRAARDWLTASPARVGYAVVAAVLLLTWPFGGWSPAVEAGARTPVGREVSAAPFTVTVERAVAGVDLGHPFALLDNGINPDQADDQHVLLMLTVRNDSARTLPVREVYADLISVSGSGEPVTTTGAPQADVSMWSSVYAGREQPQLLAGLGPGMDYELVLQQPVSGEAPEELEVELYSRTSRQSSLEDTMLWADPVLVTTVTVPVEHPAGPLYRAPWEDGGSSGGDER
ncbi:hypothetical protein [Ornithinimicrobium avium]|uniref:hypothetical protein n=1 Tax=Ornithinimicrobium avium TaxID=2283195 RepID=UPI0013B443EC|nr:hypothetical protein [Ornithinimicrobium avium]